jgi:alpha-L-rhamnosidase
MKTVVERLNIASLFHARAQSAHPTPSMPLPFLQHAAWIWSAEGTHAAPPVEARSPSHYQVRMFRRSFRLPPTGARLEVHVSADSRYLFFCNGMRIGRGPAKGDVNHHFYESFDLTPHLRPGRNVLAAIVLDMSRVAHRPAFLGAPCSIMTYAGGFLLEGELRDPGGALIEDVSTNARWKVAVDAGHRFQNENTTFEGYHGYFEHRVSRLVPPGWHEVEFDDHAWAAATVLFPAERLEHRRDPASPYGLVPRMIPMLEEERTAPFADAFAPGGQPPPPDWTELVAGRGAVVVGPHHTAHMILDAGELTTAYPVLATSGGAGAVVRLTYAEALRLPWGTPGARLLGHPQPLANLASHFADESTGWTFDRRGTISGWCDIWEPRGDGDETFEPLHWRTFRYIGLQITTAAAPLRIRGVHHRFTAYPYGIRAHFTCSDPRLDRIWRVALHTVRLCSHETFDDGPYYEQMQYAGDTMITSRIGMLASGDYRLTRQSLYHFDWSRLPDGLTQSRYPSRLVQVIPSWSLHWITHVREFVYCSGDLATARDLMPGIRAVLDWFRRHGDHDGLPARLPYWNITDWCPWWPRGVVPGAGVGATCIISAQFVNALDEAADLCRLLGHEREAAELLGEAAALREALHARFWSEADGLYHDRPGGPELSQYGNAWGIVCGAAGPQERARMLARFPHDPKLAPGSFFWWHTGFRALALCGAYDRMTELLGPWHEMVDFGLSTFAEENSYWRSLCHAWSAHPALEFLTRVLGVTPRRPGFAEIDITPHRCGLAHASGGVCTPRGLVSVRWRIEGGRFAIEVEAPAATPVYLTLPDGGRRAFDGGSFSTAVELPAAEQVEVE